MKKILIFSHAMEIGGVEKALLGLLEAIDTTRYSVDLFLMRHSGELLKFIPDNIHLLPEKSEYASLAIPIKDVIKKGQFGVAYGRLVGKIQAAKRVKKLQLPDDNGVALECSHKYTLSMMPKISNTKYDLAISFLTPHYFVAEKVMAKKKVAWIHTDYTKMKVDVASEVYMWDKYDVIASISDHVTKNFIATFPELKSKIQVIENIMPVKYIMKLKDAFTIEEEMPQDGSVKLLSIGRFCNAKNFDNVPFICKKIRESGINVKWYLVGYGGDEKLIYEKIRETNMQKYVIVLGKKENPYPYIKACDIYVQPSRYEGKCVSVIEAQILKKPVIISNYATSSSQLIDGVDGVIVPMDNDSCASGIIAVIKNKELQNSLSENNKKNNYSNICEVERLYQIMEK